MVSRDGDALEPMAAMSETSQRPAPCPLCGSAPVRPFRMVRGREYRECSQCGMIHLAPAHRLTAEAERAEYSTHQNSPADPRYRAFLNRLAVPLVERLPPGAEGLDFGAGPGPTLSVMLQEQGFPMAVYDHFFAPDRSVLGRRFDFITCTETAEHFFEPGVEFERLSGLLRPGGWLGVMTESYTGRPPFEQWRYAREPTHVSFYRPETMRWIALQHGWSLESPGTDVFLFRNPAPAINGTHPTTP